jgi:uncharacterized protein
MPDFFAPAFRVEVNGSKLAADVSKNVEEVTVVSKPDTLDTFTLTLLNAYPEMRWTHTQQGIDLFKEGNGVKIALGYVDDLEPMFDGEITKITPNFPDSGPPTLNIEGHTRLHWLLGDRKSRAFPGMTDKQIVEKIAQDNGLEAKADDPGVQYDYISQNNQTDLEFIRARAGRIHYEVLVQEKTLIFRKAHDSDSKIYTLVWGQTQKGLSGQANVLPLKTFSVTLNTLQQTGSVTVRGYDPQTKKEIVGRAGAGDENSRMGGSVTGPQISAGAFHKQRQYVRVGTPVASQAEADELARAIYNDRAMEFLTGNGSTIGIPDLRAGNTVSLEGLGPRFSGLYYIDEATHSLGGTGYLTNFTAKRNAVG